MKERDDVLFYDISSLKTTEGIEERADSDYILKRLTEIFPEEKFEDVRVTLNDTGVYQGKFTWFDRLWGSAEPVEGLPPYYEVAVSHRTGKHTEELIVWSPAAWNDRFAGTAGGGTGIGGRSYLTRPLNTQRGWSVPFAVRNGFTAATMYAGNIQGWHDYTLDKETGKLDRELYDNWLWRSTHNMTLFGKAIAQILHDRPVLYSYISGGSGGGRQCLTEVQRFPQDYDGVWASCPAINWHKFLMAGFWPSVVMNEYHHFLSPQKNRFMLEAAQNHCGGAEKYYHLSLEELTEELKDYDFSDCVGKRTGKRLLAQTITKLDAEIMHQICLGPRKNMGIIKPETSADVPAHTQTEPEFSSDQRKNKAPDNSFLWYGFRPGVRNWQVVIPVGTYYYPTPFSRNVKPFILGPLYAKWITENPRSSFKDMGLQEYVALFEDGLNKFSDNLSDDPAIEEFVNKGGKLIIDHGMDDPLIPVDNTLDYYQKLLSHFGSQKALNSFMRLYINPGDNHGNCIGNGPGITEKAGMTALMKWVEEGEAPEGLRKVRTHPKSGELLEEGIALPYDAS